ncbi:MAG: D-alanyl-D-alanine carboxypeptidase [Actinomycetota bacterium]|nr:D-alanyl-D-alanine carboxypeptidase [Actinomycetota bacterium]
MRKLIDTLTARRLAAPALTFVLALTLALVAASVPGWSDAAWALQGEAREVEEPEVVAGAWALTDLRSGELLAGEDASVRLPIASTTKIMAALVALDSGRLKEEVTVSRRAAAFATPAYSNVGLEAGEVLSVRELLMASMISSGDDAAYALAEHLGGEAGVDGFVGEMNREAGRLGLGDTRFENPVGFDARGHYSSAQDLAEMTRVAMRDPEFREMVATEYASVSTPYREIQLTNTNELLFSYPPATGVKTGTTPAAGETLVASATAGDESYVCVVLDAGEDRFAASARALEYGFAAYDRVELLKERRRYARAEVPYRRGETVELVAERSVEGLVDASPSVELETRLREELPDSARTGTRLGEVVVRVDGEKVGQSPLVARKGYKEASPLERVWYTVEGIFAKEKQ